MEFTRRSFLAGAVAGAIAATLPSKRAEAAVSDNSYATLIDLSKCDGCKDKDTPLCVSSCASSNAHKFPKPDKSKIKDYWPQKKHEDWSDKQHIKDRLTPYNWTFVQDLKVQHDGETHDVSVPRRCMHCDNPACVKLCPFGTNHKDPQGPVYIDPSMCFGGAKCRTVCPWSVPQRQAGVGIYTYLQPLPVGGGVMYKCDLCRDRLAQNKLPSCVEACPNNAIKIGKRSDVFEYAKKMKEEKGLHIYGMDENGGTSTLYLSKIPFEAIDKAITAAAKNPKKAMRMHKAKSKLEDSSELATAALIAPLAAIAGAFAVTAAANNKKEDSDNE